MKTVKFYILKPIDSDWKTFGKSLRDLQYQTAKSLNHCMTEWYLWQVKKEAVKVETGKYPSSKEFPPPQKSLYEWIRAKFPGMHSRIRNEIVQKSKQRWTTDTKDCFYRLNKSLPTFKKTHPVLISGQQYRLENIDGEIIMTFSLWSKNQEGQKRFSIQLATKKVTGSQRAILNRLVSGEYKKRTAQIGFNERKRKWFIGFPYEPEKKDRELDQGKILGIDLGIKYTFYASVLGSKDRLYADGSEVTDFRKKVKSRRRKLSMGGPFSGRKGRGKKVYFEPIHKIGDKERRFRDTKYHQYSSQIIKFALKHNAGVIQLENLDSLKKAKIGNFVLNDWAIAELHQKIEYKAEHEGIRVVYVDPRYTSQRCSECGHIDSGNRPEQEVFKCLNCGFEENADRNAALNLATPDIENIIIRSLQETRTVSPKMIRTKMIRTKKP